MTRFQAFAANNLLRTLPRELGRLLHPSLTLVHLAGGEVSMARAVALATCTSPPRA